MSRHVITILNRLKTSLSLTVHTGGRTSHRATHTGLSLRTLWMTLLILRAHVHTRTNPPGEAPFVDVTRGKGLCATAVLWQRNLFDGCCCCCCAWKPGAARDLKRNSLAHLFTIFTACTAVHVQEPAIMVSHVRASRFADNSITLYTPRAHARILTSQHAEAPFVAVIKG